MNASKSTDGAVFNHAHKAMLRERDGSNKPNPSILDKKRKSDDGNSGESKQVRSEETPMDTRGDPLILNDMEESLRGKFLMEKNPH